MSIYLAEGISLKALEKHLVAKGRWVDDPPPGCTMPSYEGLGGMYSAAAAQIFGDLMEAGKVMGLAPYGKPEIPLEEFLEIRDGRFRFSDRVCRRFNDNRCWPARQRAYQNLAASVQVALEDALMVLVHRLRELSPYDNLVYAGGVALNSVANERIIRESGFQRVYIMPAAEDSGPAVGAAYYGLWKLTENYTPSSLHRDAMGRPYDRDETIRAISQAPAVRPVASDDVIRDTADLLIDGRIVGWFEGPSELGPRALGQRSILCDPRRPDAKDAINSRVKHREAFRPFAPVVLLEEVENWFELDSAARESPFMLRIMKFRDDRKDAVPAVVHVDGTGRVQTVTRAVNGPYYDLVRVFFEKTGVPILLNTSMNVMGEPIVETPEDALWCLLLSDLDYCVLDGTLVTKKERFRSWKLLYPYFLVPRENILKRRDGAVVFKVRTPWCQSTIDCTDPREILVVEAMIRGLLDGSTSCGELFGRIRQAVGQVPDQWLIRLMAQLRRTRVISFAESPRSQTPSDQQARQ
jgi:carbamoyltransferase